MSNSAESKYKMTTDFRSFLDRSKCKLSTDFKIFFVGKYKKISESKALLSYKCVCVCVGDL